MSKEESHLAEVREFVDCVVNNKPSITTRTESVLMSIKVALQSLSQQKQVKQL